MKSFNTYKFSMNPGILTKLSKFLRNMLSSGKLTVDYFKSKRQFVTFCDFFLS